MTSSNLSHASAPEGINERVKWGPRDAIAGILAALVLAGLIGTLLGLASSGFEKDGKEDLTIGALGTVLFEIGLASIAIVAIRRRDPRMTSLRMWGSGWSPVATILTLAAAYVAYFGYLGIVSLSGVQWLEPSSQLPSKVFEIPVVLAVLGYSVILVAPLAEEVFFRGFVFQGFMRLGVLPAAILSGLIFSSAHANVGAVIPFTMIGAIFALSFQKSGSLITPIFAHGLFNAVSFSALLFIPELRP